MKNIYLLLFISFLLSACSKDFLKKYDKRIVGRWELRDIDRVGFGGSINNQVFQPGIFNFQEDGTVTYELDGLTYNGGWDIDKDTRTTGCHTDNDGNTQCNTEVMHQLFISVTEPASQYTRTEHFDNMDFKSKNRFDAYIDADFKTYVFNFRRMD